MKIALALLAAAVAAASAPALAVHTADGWRSWWRADRAPARWAAADRTVAGQVRWRTAAPGVELGELRLSGAGEAWRVRVVLARLDPAKVRLRLVYDGDPLNRPNRWSVDDAPAEALVALNAGQFDGRGPWGWVVQDGVERRPPGPGPLAPALVVDSAGRARIVPVDSLDELRRGRGIETAFQSYPAVLLEDGVVPAPLREAGRGVSITHRDARLAVGTTRDGRILVALTRFEGLGGVLSNLPFGLTTPEMAALMGALGAGRAMLLDGGLSSQLLVREADETHTWRGLRKVPAGLVAVAR